MTYSEQALFPNQESLPEGFPAKTYQLLADVLGWPENDQVYFGKSHDSLMISNPDGSFSKTSLAYCRPTQDGIWESCSGRWLNSGMGSHTGFLTLKTSESPSVVVECSLSDVLEATGKHLQKYLLSAKACSGILRRATRRGKKLPDRLHKALLHRSKQEDTKE